MKILFIPQVSISESSKIVYEFGENIISATHNGIKDTFDFTGVPEGELKLHSEDGEDKKISKMEQSPLISAVKKDGVLYLRLINYISENATHEEKFPEWIDAKDYVSPEKEFESEALLQEDDSVIEGE